jgi:hypothetical protein
VADVVATDLTANKLVTSLNNTRTGVFWIKACDTSGNWSLNAARASLDIYSTIDINFLTVPQKIALQADWKIITAEQIRLNDLVAKDYKDYKINTSAYNTAIADVLAFFATRITPAPWNNFEHGTWLRAGGRAELDRLLAKINTEAMILQTACDNARVQIVYDRIKTTLPKVGIGDKLPVLPDSDYIEGALFQLLKDDGSYEAGQYINKKDEKGNDKWIPISITNTIFAEKLFAFGISVGDANITNAAIEILINADIMRSEPYTASIEKIPPIGWKLGAKEFAADFKNPGNLELDDIENHISDYKGRTTNDIKGFPVQAEFGGMIAMNGKLVASHNYVNKEIEKLDNKLNNWVERITANKMSKETGKEGKVVFPGGFIMVWFEAGPFPGQSERTIPIPPGLFPNKCLGVSVMTVTPSDTGKGDSANDMWFQLISFNDTQIIVFTQDSDDRRKSITAHILAWGY